MGNDSSKPRDSSKLQPHPANKVQRRLSTDSGRRYRASPSPNLPASNSSISCSDGYLTPNCMSNGSSRLSIDNGSETCRSRSGSTSSTSIKSNQKHPIPLKNRQLIQSCFQNAHEIIGRKIIKRAAEKRADFRAFYSTLNPEERELVETQIKFLLKKAVTNLDYLDEIQRLSEEFGERFVSYRACGFKADYFAVVADATITECTFLDNAVHPAHLTLASFSQFVTIVFTSVRDGFYNGMRKMRRSSHSFSTGTTIQVPRQQRLSVTSVESPRSKSPSMTMRKLTDQVYSPTLLVNGSDPFLHS